MVIGMAADHGGFELKQRLADELISLGHSIIDFGADRLMPGDDYPDFVIPLANAVATGEVERGIAVCGSGVGAAIAANKIANVRAALITDCFSARQGVEDDNMNIICLGGRVVAYYLALDLIKAFLGAQFKSDERFQRRLDKITEIEKR
ncbi:MAG: RpiB/LacA/LacB family sugar-phosphate isomerase [Armatimonadota bacterium]|jgi:ribose 5-phosphate isomerase B